MRGLSALIVWCGVVLFVAAGLLLLFYAAALLLPIILAVFAGSLLVGWYRQFRNRKMFVRRKTFFDEGETMVKPSKYSSKIIDAEFELIDEKERKF